LRITAFAAAAVLLIVVASATCTCWGIPRRLEPTELANVTAYLQDETRVVDG
jgi:hypothetical protein